MLYFILLYRTRFVASLKTLTIFKCSISFTVLSSWQLLKFLYCTSKDWFHRHCAHLVEETVGLIYLLGCCLSMPPTVWYRDEWGLAIQCCLCTCILIYLHLTSRRVSWIWNYVMVTTVITLLFPKCIQLEKLFQNVTHSRVLCIFQYVIHSIVPCIFKVLVFVLVC
jgi:hypothetical protein